MNLSSFVNTQSRSRCGE